MQALFGNGGGNLEGKIVLVTGGAGAVGYYAIQWAKRLGAYVVATISSPVKEGGMRHTVSAVYPLARTGEAHEAVEFHAKHGTVVVDCTG